MKVDDAVYLAYNLMQVHGVKGWELKLDNAKNRMGVTRFDRKVIGLSKPLIEVNEIEEVQDIILHEIAHVLAGRWQGHNEKWRRLAVHVGASGNRLAPVTVNRAPFKYAAFCPTCLHEWPRHRRSTARLSCPDCHVSIKWRVNY